METPIAKEALKLRPSANAYETAEPIANLQFAAWIQIRADFGIVRESEIALVGIMPWNYVG